MSSSPSLQVVPPQGSLALLAYGDLGVEAWRAAREAAGLDRCSHSTPITKSASSRPEPDAPLPASPDATR